MDEGGSHKLRDIYLVNSGPAYYRGDVLGVEDNKDGQNCVTRIGSCQITIEAFKFIYIYIYMCFAYLLMSDNSTNFIE